MPVPTEQLASDIRESDRRLTDAVNDLGRKVDANQAEVFRKIDSVQVELARKIDSVQAEMDRKIDSVQVEVFRKIDAAQAEFSVFRAEIVAGLEALRARFDSALAVAKWSIGLSVPLLVTLLGFTASMIWHASKLETLVRQHKEILRPQKDVGGVAPASRVVAEHRQATGR